MTYTPNPGFSGADTFNYTVSDDRGGFDTASITVTTLPGTNFLLGDVNQDDVVNFLDISAFISALTSGYQIEADMNQDATVNFLDIAPFIAALTAQ